ncbi:MAG: hypothetical protein WD512_07270 [Candidatus Paceibacterota bacterium]
MSEGKIIGKIKNVNGKKRVKDNFEPHPNTIFGVPLDIEKTEGGVYLPENIKTPTPLVEIYSVGKNVKEYYDVGDVVYVNAQLMGFGEIEGVQGVILMVDAIYGKKVKKDE